LSAPKEEGRSTYEPSKGEKVSGLSGGGKSLLKKRRSRPPLKKKYSLSRREGGGRSSPFLLPFVSPEGKDSSQLSRERKILRKEEEKTIGHRRKESKRKGKKRKRRQRRDTRRETAPPGLGEKKRGTARGKTGERAPFNREKKKKKAMEPQKKKRAYTRRTREGGQDAFKDSSQRL